MPYISLLTAKEPQNSFDSYRCNELARLFILDSLQSLLPTTPEASSPAFQFSNPVERALDYVNHHLHHPIAIADIAKHSCLSERQLRRLFKASMGKTIVEAINERRMERAAQQLLMRFSVAQVAEMFGIASVAYFSRTFTKYIGVSPKQFQARSVGDKNSL